MFLVYVGVLVCLVFGRGMALSLVLVRLSVALLLLSEPRLRRCTPLVLDRSFNLRALCSACEKYIILPVLLSVPTPSQGGGTPPEGYGFMMFVVRVAGSLPGVWWFTLPLSLMTGGLCHRLRLDAIAACRPCECLVEVVSYRAGVDQRV